MAIQLTNGALFLHIPKTGGTWVEHVLRESGYIDRQIQARHSNWDRTQYFGEYLRTERQALRLLGRSILERAGLLEPLKPLRPFTFCFVRDPLTWYESWWRFMMEKGWRNWGNINDEKNWHPCAVLNGLGDADFNKFVANVLAKRPGFVSELYASYAHPSIDFVGKTENLRSDMEFVMRKMGLEIPSDIIHRFPEQNRSSHLHALKWDEGLRKDVVQCEWLGIRRFHYD